MQSASNSQPPQISPQEEKNLSDMVKFLSRAVNQIRDFGPEHPLTKASIEHCFSALSNLLEEKGNIAIYIAEQKLRYGNTILEEKNIVVDKIINLFSAIKLTSFQFESGFTRQDFLSFLNLLAQRPQDILAGGGLEKLVIEKNIAHLKINPIKYELIGIDEKVVSKEAGGLEGISADSEKELEEWLTRNSGESLAKTEEKKSEEKTPEQLLSLIDVSLREETEKSIFVDKLVQDPLEEAHAIIEAMRMVNKVGGEKAKEIICSVTNKLNQFQDSLYAFMVEGKEDETTKQVYKSAEVLGKELTKQLKTIRVLPEFQDAIAQMQFVLNMILDQTEAQRILSAFLKGEKTLKKKAGFFEKIIQRQKVSAEFEYFIKKILVLKGTPEEEINRLFEQKLAILEQVEQEKEAEIRRELKPTLEKLSEKQLNPDQALAELDTLVAQLVEVKIKSTTKKLQKDNERLFAQVEILSAAFQELIKENKISPEKQEEFNKIISTVSSARTHQS